MKRLMLVLSFVLVLFSSSLISGCVGTDPQIDDGINLPKNPLQGVELDLAYSDVMAAMLRTNDLMINRVPISADDSWPTMLSTPRDEIYTDWLESRLADDFSYYKYYGDMNLATFDFSFEWVAQRAMTEASQKVARELEHQMLVISYMPVGCDSPIPPEIEAPAEEYCSSVISNHNCACDFFDGSLETQIKSPALAGSLDNWVSTPVTSACLVQSKAITDDSYTSFAAAFKSLLPHNAVQDIEKAEEAIGDVAQHLRQVKTEKEELKKVHKEKAKYTAAQIKSEKQTLADNEMSGASQATLDELRANVAQLQAAMDKEDVQFEAKREAFNTTIDALKADLEREGALYAKLLEDALESPEGTPENIRLAKNLVLVADAVNDNLVSAMTGTTTMLGKLVGDVVFLTQSSFDPTQAAAAMVAEIQTIDKVQSEEKLQELALQRVELDIERAALLLPNAMFLYSEIARQQTLMTPRADYLHKFAALK